MTRSRRSLIRSIVTAGSLSLVGAAAGQSDEETTTAGNTTTGSGTTSTPPTATGTDAPATASGERSSTRAPENRVAVQISPATHVSEYEYRAGAFHLTVWSALPTTLTLTESVVRREAGAGTMNVRQVSLDRGVTETTIDAPMVDGMAVVTLTTPQSINQGTGAFLQAGAPGLQIFDGAATWGLTGLASVASFGGGLWGSKRWREKKRDEQDDREVNEL